MRKDEDIASLQRTHEEASLEMKNMDLIRQKLNEHIIYL